MSNSIGRGAKAAGSAAESVADSPLLTGIARVGLTAYGVVYLLIGWLALKIAWGASPESGDQTGALATIADAPFGRILLYLLIIGLVAMMLWQFANAAFAKKIDDEDGAKGVAKRIGEVITGSTFGALAFTTFRMASGQGASSSQSQQEQTSGIMALPFGRPLAILIGLVIVGVGIFTIVRAIQRTFLDHIDSAVPPAIRTWIERAGLVGYIANGIGLSLIGALFAYAAITFDPAKSTGLDGALRTILTAPFGRFLLTFVALGFVCYGLFQFARARYERL
ncbi:DUF1206 domain-containing protein [Millisia brevis]|uniref:DUF1206 domain-containing protein n=1 Tax=Millisia brevis TaxID=264148 RepID=UPI000830748B|nr:DUF1206 domain-containing protein [Millisia brevis]